MPEYLAPGVYVEEVSFRSKSIEGVPTSTTGFAGMTRFGPVQYTDGPTTTEPRLITSFTEFERVYGGLEPLLLGSDERIPYLAHAARAFFLNGGQRLYVSRVFAAGSDDGVARLEFTVGTEPTAWRARWPGAMGNVWVRVQVQRSGNVVQTLPGGAFTVNRVRTGTVVEVYNGVPAADLPKANDPVVPTALNIVTRATDGTLTFTATDGTPTTVDAASVVQVVEVNVRVVVDGEREDFYPELSFYPDHKRFIGRILQRDDPADENAVVWLDWKPDYLGKGEPERLTAALQLAAGLAEGRLIDGNDGALASAADLMGLPADVDIASKKATGLEALGEVDDIAIVATPDASTLANDDEIALATDNVITHATRLRYRIAVVDGPPESSMNEIRRFRGRFDSKYAALYHPWIVTLDPLERAAQGAPPRKLLLPPSGFVCGIYARTDIERGVHKAPANEVVRGLTSFEININKPRQDVLNPEGINALRFFEGRGSRVWGARTMSSDPEWKYVNVRRYFNYLEATIDRGTQWAVFEPNGERLWANIRETIGSFLYNEWVSGALLGATPKQAFFVRCDRSTMTQNDLDDGRLICLVGVAVLKPAEFVIFRIGQKTIDSSE
jgi:hypothetical protein